MNDNLITRLAIWKWLLLYCLPDRSRPQDQRNTRQILDESPLFSVECVTEQLKDSPTWKNKSWFVNKYLPMCIKMTFTLPVHILALAFIMLYVTSRKNPKRRTTNKFYQSTTWLYARFDWFRNSRWETKLLTSETVDNNYGVPIVSKLSFFISHQLSPSWSDVQRFSQSVTSEIQSDVTFFDQFRFSIS